MDYFSSHETNEFLDIFNLFDKDGGGSIGADELESLLHALGKYPSPEEIEKLLAMVDEDGSGEVEFDEFLQLLIMLEQSDGHSETQLKSWFQTIDKSKKGTIESADLLKFMQSLAVHGGVCREDLELDPDKSLKDRAMPFDAMLNHTMMNTNMITGEEARQGITFVSFCKIVEELDM